MGKKIILVKNSQKIYRIFEQNISKIYFLKYKTLPRIPSYKILDKLSG